MKHIVTIPTSKTSTCVQSRKEIDLFINIITNKLISYQFYHIRVASRSYSLSIIEMCIKETLNMHQPNITISFSHTLLYMFKFPFNHKIMHANDQQTNRKLISLTKIKTFIEYNTSGILNTNSTILYLLHDYPQ